jgi:hypothetical protein
VPDDTTTGSVTVPLVPGVDVQCAMTALDGTVEVGIEHEGELVEKGAVDPATPGKHFELDLGRLRVDVNLAVDNSLGEVSAHGEVEARDPLLEQWHTLAKLDDVVLRYNPTHGSVGRNPDPDPPLFDDPEFGRTQMSSKNVTRIFVEDRERVLADVGRVVKRTLWDDYPDWVFNTVACVGPHDEKGRGTYGDPSSIWFNVFLGYYQIDAPKPDWKRPFAYSSADGAGSPVRPEEIVRLGKSDWNYFSNWMYGVPADAALRHNEFDMRSIKASQGDAGTIGSSVWHRVKIEGVDFVSAYEADHPEAARLVDNALVTRLWRKAFGEPSPRAEFAESFIGTTLDADMYIAYWEDDEAFHTAMFGGTAPSGSDPAFLAAQMAAAKDVISRSYGEIGFS